MGGKPIGDRELTFCVACGSSRHTLRECQSEFTPLLRSLQHMWQAIQNYPRPYPVGHAREGAADVPMRSAEDGVPMETEIGSAASSTTRRPKAKARPRQPTVMANVIIIRYDNPRDLGTDVANRRGKYLVYGVDSEEVGPVSQDAVGKLIENVSDTRDRQLPQRGDQPKFAVDVGTGLYVNKGYSCTSDGVKGRILELMPLEGVQFIHRDWNIVKSCRPRDVSRQAAKLSSWAMSCIQMDLRHHIGRVSGTTTLDGRGGILLHDVIRCDEGGWVSIDDLVRMEVLWTARSRDITESANVRDRDQRMRLYNERLQLIINGKLLNARNKVERFVSNSSESG